MKIKGYAQHSRLDAGRSASAGSTGGVRRQPADTAPPADRVTLSAAALRMGSMEGESHIPVFDNQRVASLKQAINDHRYTIDAERVAENFQRLGKALQGNS